MKVVVLTLAVFFLTGSQARHFWQQDDPQSQWDRVKDLATVYMDAVKDRCREYVAQFEASALGKNLNLQLLEYCDSVGSAATKLGEKVSPTAQEFWGGLLNITRVLAQKMNKDLDNLKEMVKPHLEDFEKKWQEEVNLYSEKVTPLAQQFRDSTRQTLQSLQENLTEFSQQLRGELEPFHDQLRQCFTTRLEALKGTGAGLSEFHNKASKQLQELREKATPALEDFYEAVLPIWDHMKDGLMAFAAADEHKKLTTQ
ncbi:apolipoprotein A-I [Phyllostomus hastatus]|uniref:apolipoprotein A-I n=1 Tax=Phyllostomus hastatus TaxID=9423 RepID=UPI001E67F420|nr:apolipoprotein A-I [Phyllostomus hastatus]